VVRPGPLLLSRRGFLAAATAVALPSQAWAAPPRPAGQLLQALADAEAWALAGGGAFGACALGLGAEEATLGAVDADVAVNPASNQKLVTAAVALRRLGAQHAFTTGLFGRAREGEVPSLVLRSDGDPSLTSADLARLAAELRAQGVAQVGDILVDQSAFDDQFVPPAFEQQPDEWAAFRAPVSAVAVDRNSVLVSIAPGRAGEPARVELSPSGFVDVEGEIRTSPKGRRAMPRVGLVPRGQRLLARLSGAVSEGSETLRYRQRVDDPRLLAGYALRAALSACGIGVSGEVRQGGADESHELVVRRSKPLAALLPELGKASDNFSAEMVLRAVGRRGRSGPASSAAGIEAARAFLDELGVSDAGTRIGNGSGLFDANRLSPRTMARLLVAVAHDATLAPDFLAQLAVAGVDGTLKGRFARLAARRSVLAKTGTLRDVVALSGYVLGRDRGPRVAFSCVMSGVGGRTAEARTRIDRIVELLEAETWRSAPTS
jgi:D-alanyl-D-alanine carboxypeptidase/D-alanyl-D-alanine-endopeptidase (penicillin-binding protein 4)